MRVGWKVLIGKYIIYFSINVIPPHPHMKVEWGALIGKYIIYFSINAPHATLISPPSYEGGVGGINRKIYNIFFY
jgi:hypothetical protein